MAPAPPTHAPASADEVAVGLVAPVPAEVSVPLSQAAAATTRPTPRPTAPWIQRSLIRITISILRLGNGRNPSIICWRTGDDLTTNSVLSIPSAQ